MIKKWSVLLGFDYLHEMTVMKSRKRRVSYFEGCIIPCFVTVTAYFS